MSVFISSNRLKVSALSFGLLFFQTGHAQGKYAAADAIAAERAKTLKKEVAVVVATKDTVVFQKDTKLFSAQRGQAELGLSSQWLTAAVVMVLVDEGKISLDDKVSKYLPVFSSYMKNYVTIRHCLAHFTGIQPENSKVGGLFAKKKFENLDEVAASYAKREIQNNAGEAFRFNGMGPDIAARVLEVVTKKKFDVLAQQKLFRPMGMRQTTFATLDGSTISPSTGARSTAGDYVRFLRMLLNGGTHYGQRILSESSVAAMRQIMTNAENNKYSPDAAKGWEYTMGAWAVGENDGTKAAALAAPSFEGTTAFVDFCRGYAFVYLQQELSDEARVPAGFQLKDALDPLFPANCR